MNSIAPRGCYPYMAFIMRLADIPSFGKHRTNKPYKKTIQFLDDIIKNRGCETAVCAGGGLPTNTYLLEDYDDALEWWNAVYEDKYVSKATKSKHHEQNTERKILFC